MAHDDQARAPEDRGNASYKSDACSLASYASSEECNLVADGADEEQGGHVNLVMNDLLNQPPPASVNISNSTDVRVGPSLHYNGPVTINQFLNLHHGPGGPEAIPLPNGIGRGVLSGVATPGVGACADGGKRAGGALAAPWWRRPKVLAAAGAFVVLLAAVVTVMALLWPQSGGAEAATSPATAPKPRTRKPTPDQELLLENGRRIISRSRWSDRDPYSERRLYHPTPYVVIAHTAGTACRGEDECFPLLCSYRDEHYEKWKQPDISYNFLIDVEGNIYEGRGWDATNNFQSWAKRCNLAVAFMGNFMNRDNVTEAMAESLAQLLQLGVSLGKLDVDYRLVAHRQVLSTLSPGIEVINLIEHWEHRCLKDCDVGVQCVQEVTTEVSTTTSSANQTGRS